MTAGQRHRLLLAAGIEAWEQVIPAAAMNAGRPRIWAQSASQVARSREVSSGGRRVPPASDRASGLVML